MGAASISRPSTLALFVAIVLSIFTLALGLGVHVGITPHPIVRDDAATE